LKKVEVDHQNNIVTLQKYLFDIEKKRVEKETMLRYKVLVNIVQPVCIQTTVYDYENLIQLFVSVGN